MNICISELKAQFFKYAEERSLIFTKFPLEFLPHNFGGRHLEISPEGRFSIVGTDRGKETERRETTSKDELFEWICDLYA